MMTPPCRHGFECPKMHLEECTVVGIVIDELLIEDCPLIPDPEYYESSMEGEQ